MSLSEPFSKAYEALVKATRKQRLLWVDFSSEKTIFDGVTWKKVKNTNFVTSLGQWSLRLDLVCFSSPDEEGSTVLSIYTGSFSNSGVVHLVKTLELPDKRLFNEVVKHHLSEDGVAQDILMLASLTSGS